jgi:hypothetical protein
MKIKPQHSVVEKMGALSSLNSYCTNNKLRMSKLKYKRVLPHDALLGA